MTNLNQWVNLTPALLQLTSEQSSLLTPYWVMGLGVSLAIVLAVTPKVSAKWSVFAVTLGSCAWAFNYSLSFLLSGQSAVMLFNNTLASDALSHACNLLFLSSAALTACVSLKYLDREKLQYPEYNILLLFSALGMMFMGAARDLLLIFVALELMSLSVYVLVGFRRNDRRSNEASVKYFVLGSAASAILLYGAALLYGATGSTELGQILNYAIQNQSFASPIFNLGMGLVLVGFLFKIAAVPFHMWMPDAYEGAPIPITGFMTTGLKAAAFASFLRVLAMLGYPSTPMAEMLTPALPHLLRIASVLTLIWGNLVALSQTNLKRMLAYSSIAHTGYLLIGLLVGWKTDLGFAPVVLYLLSYGIMNLGAFMILTIISDKADGSLNIPDLAGLASRRPVLSAALALFLCSMAGIPPTAGFTAKYLIFNAAVQAHEIPLVILGVLASAVSFIYYFRVLVAVYFRDPAGESHPRLSSGWSAAAVAVSAIFTLQGGLTPGRLMDWAKVALSHL